MNPESARLDDATLKLADRVFDGTASADEMQQLETRLGSSPEIRKAYLRYAILNGQLALTDSALSTVAAAPLELDSTTFSASRSPLAGPQLTGSLQPARRWRARMKRLIAVAGVIAATVLLAIWLRPWQPSRTEHAEQPGIPRTTHLVHYDDRSLPVDTVATIASGPSGPTTLENERGEAQFDSINGVDVRLVGATMFGLSSPASGVLFDGMVSARLSDPNSSYSVEMANLRVVDLGTEFRVSHAADELVRVEVLDGEVDVQSRIRLPLYFFSFDSSDNEPGSEATDLIQGTRYVIGPATSRVPGLVGDGALAFDNTADSFVRVLGGTSNVVGSGGMACSSGISIEAMFVSDWTAEMGDYDEIFRKDDGVNRILLCLQNDETEYAFPKVEPGPCLSFGLYLSGHGYHELDMPLDGREGRPSREDLCDGTPHHVVAVYNSFTGQKALYIDGRLCFAQRYPVGTLIISGGPVAAEIGCRHEYEPFNGVIDEVAYYDFALTQGEISAHYRNASSGQSYFGIEADQLPSTRWKSLVRIQEGRTHTFDMRTGLPVDRN